MSRDTSKIETIKRYLAESYTAEALDLRALWRDPSTLDFLGTALGQLFNDNRPSIVVGTESRGFLLGPLTATRIGCGFVEVRKRTPIFASAITTLAEPDSRGEIHRFSLGSDLVRPDDRVLMVDDWLDSGAQAYAALNLVKQCQATWVGVAVIASEASRAVNQELNVRSILNLADLSREDSGRL